RCSRSAPPDNRGRALRATMKLPVLLYHKIDRIPPGARYPRSYVTPERFEAQLAFLRRRGYESISFADYLAYRRGAAGLPRRPVQVLAYPYGAHNAPSRHLAAEAGYEAAVAIRRRMNGDDTDLFALRRIPVTSETSVARFAWDLFRLSWFYGT